MPSLLFPGLLICCCSRYRMPLCHGAGRCRQGRALRNERCLLPLQPGLCSLPAATALAPGHRRPGAASRCAGRCCGSTRPRGTRGGTAVPCAAAPRRRAAPSRLRSASPPASMSLCRAASQALASRLSRAPAAASRLKQRGTRGRDHRHGVRGRGPGGGGGDARRSRAGARQVRRGRAAAGHGCSVILRSGTAASELPRHPLGSRAGPGHPPTPAPWQRGGRRCLPFHVK